RRVCLGTEGAADALARAGRVGHRGEHRRLGLRGLDADPHDAAGRQSGGSAGRAVDRPAGGRGRLPEWRGGGHRPPHPPDLPNTRVSVRWVGSAPHRPSALRSLGGTANTTANESFLDELAAAAGVDPIAFHLRYLTDPRAIEVVTKVAEVSGWQARRSGPV